jgi:hypothetical protein
MAGRRDKPSVDPPDADEGAPEPVDKEERARQVFFEHLARRGELIDVDEDAQLDTLPPRVTHVRYPDGRVERVGFS